MYKEIVGELPADEEIGWEAQLAESAPCLGESVQAVGLAAQCDWWVLGAVALAKGLEEQVDLVVNVGEGAELSLSVGGDGGSIGEM